MKSNYIKFYQKSDRSARQELENPQTQAAKGLQRLNSILAGMEYVAPGCAPRYINLDTSSSAEGGAE